jgi:hypothetical protein
MQQAKKENRASAEKIIFGTPLTQVKKMVRDNRWIYCIVGTESNHTYATISDPVAAVELATAIQGFLKK